jgi:dipeptidyl-peptidase-4
LRRAVAEKTKRLWRRHRLDWASAACGSLLLLIVGLCSAAERIDPSLLHDPAATIQWTSPSALLIGSSTRSGIPSVCEEIDAETGARRVLSDDEHAKAVVRRLEGRPLRSRSNGPDTSIAFRNLRNEAVTLYWIDQGGTRRGYGQVAAGETRSQHTFAGHAWLVEAAGKPLGWIRGEPRQTEVVIDEQLPVAPPSERRGEQEREDSLPPLPKAATEYAGPGSWSPDQSRVVVWEVSPAQEHPVHLVESAPSDRVEPRLKTLDYLKPGDRIEQRWPRLFTKDGEEIAIGRELFANPWSINRLRWASDGSFFTVLFNERGHQRLRLVAVDAATGEARTVVEEASDTFVDYAHKVWMHWLADEELVWMSERDGFNHLYLVDVATGSLRQITEGPWMVREVERVDDEARELTLRVLGINPGEDPYHTHWVRVSIDDGSLVRLTHGNGIHELTWSPDRRWYVDSFSRVDLPPVHELRKASDGSLVCELGRADASELVNRGWVMPERFVAKGRDGATDIYGVIYRPQGSGADSTPRPVVEQIYAGPHGFHVPVGFAVSHGQQKFTDEGFVLVRIDGMGTNWRGKAFHDVCWKNLRDAGFPDRVAWLKAAAAERPWMDLSRVGIFGGSAGGQNAMRGLLDYPEIYKVGVADCGCHDNRMDKIWWNELWMGWPVDEAYERSSNVVDADRLEGELMLIVGELDENVDPSSTLQVSAALVKAGKEHELVVIPGAGHGAAETPYGSMKRLGFLKRHLQP